MMKRKILGSMLLAATLVTGVAATPAEAHRRHHQKHYNTYQDDGYYNRDRGYDNRNYQDDRQYRSNRSCNKGTGGLIIGGVAGGLLGSEVARRGNKTTGTIIGAAVGALAGRAIDRSDSRCR
jgi:uncharacterized protein YcfJ